MWLYIPSTTSNSAPGPECSEPPSNSPSKPSEFRPCLYVTLSGKASPRPLSWRGWKSRGWVSRLSGTTLEPSTAARGVDSWIASVAATLANRFPWRVSDLARKIPDIFGPASVKSLRESSRHSVFSKTCQATLFPDLIESSTIWKDWITGLRQDCLHRRKSARPCEMNGYTSWPRPQARDEKNPDSPESGNYKRKVEKGWTIDLNSMAANWLRPIASIYKDGRTSAKFKSKSPNSQTLNEQAVGWTGTIPRPETIGDLGLLLQVWKPPECPRLNARFAEWLMGWPRDLTSFGLSETGWIRWRRHTLSCIYSLISRKDEIYAHSGY